MDSKNRLILPVSQNRLTFDNKIDTIENSPEPKEEYELVQDAFEANYDMYPLLARRHLGNYGISAAYLLTPRVGTTLARNFNWRRDTVESVTDRFIESHSTLDPYDTDIYLRFLALREMGEFGPKE